MISSLTEVPTAENALFEFKGNRTSSDSLGKKLCKAALAFSNAGGGILLAGVNDSGEADGGILPYVGRDPISDWIDKNLQLVRPAVDYSIETFSVSDGRGVIDGGKVVVVAI